MAMVGGWIVRGGCGVDLGVNGFKFMVNLFVVGPGVCRGGSETLPYNM